MKNISNWFSKNYLKIVRSIAFYPGLIAIGFLLLSFMMTLFDFSETGKHVKQNLSWLSLRDATTARSIISSIVSGIISLAVFSFSMVMIVLNQTASQMSNRILDNLIGNRFQQVVLGIYIGTIVFALFLLSTIRDINSGIYIPAISTYFLIVLTIADIFLFIYFLHYITQSVKYEVIIKRIFEDTIQSLEKLYPEKGQCTEKPAPRNLHEILSPETGIFGGIQAERATEICKINTCNVYIHVCPGTFVFAGAPIAGASCKLKDDDIKQMLSTFIIQSDETITQNYFYGLRQLAEVAMKALSPGINDPATAIQAMRSLARLFTYRLQHATTSSATHQQNQMVFVRQMTIDEMLQRTLLPIFDYGKNDRMVLLEFETILAHLLTLSDHKALKSLQAGVRNQIEKKIAHPYLG